VTIINAKQFCSYIRYTQLVHNVTRYAEMLSMVRRRFPPVAEAKQVQQIGLNFIVTDNVVH